ncbi:MAG: nucleotidyltransferase domain-containing protein [Candidatus Omnitrophica bacterium]|nr:nucleotidyltransferase domain-containing protein [Candidatus Omnitrophota bacterium]
MKLTIKEQKIIKAFKNRIRNKFSTEIIEVIIFGSKARGDAAKDSDIDILVVTASDNWEKSDKIRKIGYTLDEDIEYKLSIQVMAKSHIDYLRRNKFQFIENVEKEGIFV